MENRETTKQTRTVGGLRSLPGLGHTDTKILRQLISFVFNFLGGCGEGRMKMGDREVELMALRLTLAGDAHRKSGVKA